MKIREKCEKCNNYYGQNELYFAKNKSEHLKKCGFKIKCDDCTEFSTTSLSLNESEEKLKNHQIKECNKSRKWRKLVACKDIIGGDCKHFFIDENNNGPNDEKLKKHLNQVHNGVSVISCKRFMQHSPEWKNNQCKFWFKRHLDSKNNLTLDWKDIEEHLKNHPHFIIFTE